MIICAAELMLTGPRLSFLANPNIIASFLVVVAFMGRQSAAWWVAIGAALLGTGSRGGLLGLLGALAAAARIPFRWAGIAGLGILLLLIVARPTTVADRLGTWTEAMYLFARRPVLGWGLGTYSLLARHHPESAHADSAPLTIAAETGLLGLAAWGWLMGAAGRAVARSPDSFRLGLIAWAVHQLVDHTMWWCWVFIPVCIALSVTVREESDGRTK
jgi:O-antigen ligase